MRYTDGPLPPDNPYAIRYMTGSSITIDGGMTL